jgi:regulator of sigma E protease
MYILLAIALLVVAAAVHAAAVVAARRAVDRLAGDAKAPRSVGFALARGSAGIAAWYLTGSLLFTMGFLARGEHVIDDTTMRVHVAPSGPAARAGVRDGDRVMKVAGEPITSWEQLRVVVAKHPGEEIAVDVDRGGEPVTVMVTPEGSPPKILVGPWSETKKMSLGHAIGSALVAPANVVLSSFRSIMRAFSGKNDAAELTGPVGIVRETSHAAQSSLATGILLAAALAAYVLPYVAIASALYELLSRRKGKA